MSLTPKISLIYPLATLVCAWACSLQTVYSFLSYFLSLHRLFILSVSNDLGDIILTYISR